MHFKFFLPMAIAAFFAALTIHAASTDVLKSPSLGIHTASASVDQISDNRNPDLKKIALLAQSKLAARELAQVTIVCAADSGSSHLLQCWAQMAATSYGD